MLSRVTLLVRTILVACLLPIVSAAQIFVAPNGSDGNNGTASSPFASISQALRTVRELRRLNDPLTHEAIHIKVAGGTYRLDQTILVRSDDAGTAESPTIIEAVAGNNPIISGGLNIKGWQKVSAALKELPRAAKGQIWEADAPKFHGNLIDFRQLYINNNKATRARDKNADSMYRILSWNHKTQQCWIPNPKVNIANVQGLEMFIHQWWAVATLRVKHVEVVGDSARLSFHQPESKVQSEHPWPAPWISSETGNSAFYLTNALQFLDEPGEWFLDKQSQKIYYWPRIGEELPSSDVVAPYLETLLKIEGTIDNPVSNVFFKGISFQHSTWLRPGKEGHVPHQAGMFMLEAYKLKVPGTKDKATLENQAWVGRPASAVQVNYAKGVNFENCRFEHLASTGLDYHKGVQANNVTGNLFKDIGGSAMLAGTFSDDATEVHVPFNPKDERILCSDLNITNNLINNVANEDWGCVGIAAGYARNISITHNDLSELPYMGISVGWGWTKTLTALQNNNISFNKIHRYAKQLYDVAGIYTLSAQPGTTISNNYIDSVYKAPYAHLPSHWFYLYTDEGSSYITVKNNWTPSEKFLQNANGPGNTWTNNGPMVDDSVRRNAGLERPYQQSLSHRTIVNKQWKIVTEQPVVIELIFGKDAVNVDELKEFLIANKLSPSSLYKWNNRYVFFDKVQDASVIKSKLQKAFPTSMIKVYYDPFYEFNRKLCPDTTTSLEQDHIILTADLVADNDLQQAYLNYHENQFKDWPEVSKGFCNANFQRLLIYKNGRQLILIISIPKGKSLDDLNPKTTENNPRVDQWNNLMKKYQQGVEGTKPGETWVFFEKIQ